MSALQEVIDRLRHQRRDVGSPYRVPGLWVDFETSAAQTLNPFDFYADRLQAILESEPQVLITGEPGGDWTQNAITYNLFPRLTTAFDHDGTGSLDLHPDGWRETGTLLKSIAMLPYLHSMGFNTVHLLPINAIGQDGKKGSLGSPFSIRNLYRIDENLIDPALDADTELLFKAFVEAAHRLGIRVVMEFVFRVVAKDADWVAQNPEWFYWIRADIPDRAAGSKDANHFGAPIWPGDRLGELYWKVNSGQRHDLTPPPDNYRNMYTHPPRPENVRMVDGRWLGTLDDGTVVRIPGAFTDWPPESVQPPWTDVTYFRLYDHSDFNYMAYNTLRMYDNRLAVPENAVRSLWEALIGVIPHYQRTFGIDGVMIDMGHALPESLMRECMAAARQIDPDFAFWAEDFSISHENRERGYNAVMGYLIFDLHQPQRMQAFIDHIAYHRPELSFFVTPENHNTPRAGSRMNALGFSHQALLYMIALPGMPFMLSGFELFESHPINTGLGFDADMLKQYDLEKLPLFSEWAFDWTREGNMVGAIRYAFHLRDQYKQLLANTDPATVIPGSSNNPNLLVFSRADKDTILTFVFNMTMFDYQVGEAELYARDSVAIGKWGFSGMTRLSERLSIHVELSGGHSIMFEADTLR